MLKVVRYSRAIRRFHRALLIAIEEIVLFALAAALLLFPSAVGIYYFENLAQPENYKSIFHSMWWAVGTLTTVGYGDITPVTGLGKIIAAAIMLIGYAIIAVPTGIVSAEVIRESRPSKKKPDIECLKCGQSEHVPHPRYCNRCGERLGQNTGTVTGPVIAPA